MGDDTTKTNGGERDLPITTVLTLGNASAVVQIRRARLTVARGPDQHRFVQIPPQGVVVGTAGDCGLVLSDEAVSHRHFEITPDKRGLHLRDLGSTNGTRVRGLRVLDAYVGAAERIEVGNSELRLSLLPGADKFPLSAGTSFGPLIGRSLAMRRTFALLASAAASDVTVLLEGETGTGKDLAARAIHEASARRDRPLVVVDCGSLASGVLESELFGHRKGSFTGATEDRLGAFLEAQDGTAFLDEIGEMSMEMQPRLLRVLESREVRRIGETLYRPVNARVIAATNRELEREVAEGRFREDLYYRLSVMRVRMPTLRERREDIELVAESLVRRLRPDLDPAEVIGESELTMLLNHSWPGNVRELRNVVERLLLPGKPLPAIQPALGAGAVDDQQGAELMELPFHEARQACTERFERNYLERILRACGGVVTRAADKAGLPRQSLHRLLAKHGLTGNARPARIAESGQG